MDDEFEVREVPLEEAEAILVVRLFISAVDETAEFDFPLARVRKDPPEVVVTLTTLPDGSVVSETRMIHRGTFTGRGQGGISSWPTSNDQREEQSSSVYISGRSADVVEVSCSADWTVPNVGSGDFRVELVGPWLGSARADLPDGSWITAEMTPAHPADATPDLTT